MRTDEQQCLPMKTVLTVDDCRMLTVKASTWWCTATDRSRQLR